MTFAVFIHRSDSSYQDVPDSHYQFPSRYLGNAKASIGDWIVYLEPRRAREARGYFAIARVQEIIPDPAVPGMHRAIIAPESFLEFPHPVPFSGSEGPAERGLLNEQGKLSGLKQSAVRPLAPADFHSIVEAGLGGVDDLLPRVGEHAPNELAEDQTPFVFEQSRARVVQLASRPVRDRIFRRLVLSAYDERCAITGLKLINGRGRAEVEAAHIRPVEHNGPDTARNGIALSGTVHWMFDRGLISLSDDLKILVSRQVNDPGRVTSLINRSGRALTPERLAHRPHPRFLSWHREHCFKH